MAYTTQKADEIRIWDEAVVATLIEVYKILNKNDKDYLIQTVFDKVRKGKTENKFTSK